MSETSANGQRDMIVDALRAVCKGAANAALHTAHGVTHAVSHASQAVGGASKAAAGAAGSTAVATATSIRKFSYRTIAAWLLRGGFLPVLILIYVIVSSEGLRSLFDALATPLYKYVPFMGLYQELRKIDVAVIIALVLLVLVWVTWEKLVRLYLSPPAQILNEEKLLWVVGIGLIVLDATLFFIGIQAGGAFLVSAATSFLGAMVMTALYVLMLIAAAYFIVKLDS